MKKSKGTNGNPNPINPEAQERFNRLFADLSEGNITAKSMTDLIRTGLEAGGFQFENLDSIDGLEFEIVEPIFEQQKDEEKKLIEEYKGVLREAGASDVQLAWGIVNDIRLSRKQERKLRGLEKRLDELRSGMLVSVSFAAVLNEARAALG